MLHGCIKLGRLTVLSRMCIYCSGCLAQLPAKFDLNPLCYQLPNATYANYTLASDLLVHRHTIHEGSCAEFGYTVYVSNDPIFKDAALFRKRLL